MSALTRWDALRWDPLNELEEIRNRFNRMMGRFQPRQDSERETMAVAEWVPTVDVEEDDREYVIKAEIPEVDKNDVRVTAQNGVLTIQGQRRKETKENGKKFRRIERQYGMFARSFTLPTDVDEQAIRAEFRDGILRLHLPKTEKAQSKAIEVKID
jgi:HSP20 family protein